MIGIELTKENALPYDLWGLLSETWKPDPKQGVTVFLQGLEKRGPHNERKRIYLSALTPDLYRPMYGDKVVQFFDKLLSDVNTGKPLMRPYLDSYFDLYWDLHLGIKGDAVPARVREIGYAFNTVLAYRDVTQKIVYENYLTVRSHLAFLKEWIDDRLADLTNGKTPNPEKTFAHYWIKNGGEGENFAHKDVVFEVFHNFVALSQWGNTMYNIMLKLARDAGDPDARTWFKKTMEGNPDDAGGNPFTPLERFVMELFRVITPKRRQYFRPDRGANASLRTSWLCCDPARVYKLRSRPVEGPRYFQSRAVQRGTDKPRHRRRQMRSDGLCPVPI
jgi:hypothetical protein